MKSECRISNTNMHWTDLTNKTILEDEFECSHMGLLCLDLNNTEPCPDFEVRYQCRGVVRVIVPPPFLYSHSKRF